MKESKHYEVKRDCFAYCSARGLLGSASCSALDALYCKTEKCNFYKPAKVRLHGRTIGLCEQK